jgi:hypothetical protein
MKTNLNQSFFLLIFIMLFNGNCSSEPASENPKKDIIGKWESTNKTLVLEFKSDKKLYAKHENGGIVIETNTEVIFVDDNSILATWERSLQAYKISVYQDHFILTDDQGNTEKFRRIE